MLNAKCKIPDHSLLSTVVHFESMLAMSNDHVRDPDTEKNTRKFYDWSKAPVDLLRDDRSKEMLAEIISNIELTRETQDNLDDIYAQVCYVILEEMDKIPQKGPSQRTSSKRLKKRHPFWNKDLDEKWKNVMNAEKCFKKCKHRRTKKDLRYQYKVAQDEFDKLFRKYKRQHNRNKSLQIEKLSTSDPNRFWQHVKNLGPRKKQCIPMEVYTDTGGIECSPLKVLSHWQNEFEKL